MNKMMGDIRLIKLIRDSILNMIFPRNISCAACDIDLDLNKVYRYRLCDTCLEGLGWIKGPTCKSCGGPLVQMTETGVCYNCDKTVSYLENCEACFDYSGIGKDLIMDLKYNRQTYLGQVLAEMMKDVITATYSSDIDLIVSVPLHRSRLRQRGFNQMDLIGGPLSEMVGIPYSDKALVRNRKTPRLKGLNRQDRKVVMEGLFSAQKSYVRGKRILLIDDIYTTGATMNACAKALFESGALNVYGAVLSVNFRD